MIDIIKNSKEVKILYIITDSEIEFMVLVDIPTRSIIHTKIAFIHYNYNSQELYVYSIFFKQFQEMDKTEQEKFIVDIENEFNIVITKIVINHYEND